MFLSLLSHILCAWFAFALPSYATYKALAHAPSADTLQPLATYWAVVGVFVAFEQALGFFLSWLPFYYELRTIFLLYASLPQTQGSTYIYKTFLEPWFAQNEADLDASLASAQNNAFDFCRTRIAAVVDLFWSVLNKPAQSGADKPAYPVDHLKGLWAAYAPSVLSAFAPKDTKGDSAPAPEPYSVN